MFLELNTIGCSLQVFLSPGQQHASGPDTGSAGPGIAVGRVMHRFLGARARIGGRASSNPWKAKSRSANWLSRAAPACLRFRGTPRLLEDVVRRETMRDDPRQSWWADSVDLAGRDGSVDSGVVVAGILRGCRRVRGRIGGWIGDRIGGWIRGRIRGRFRSRSGG